MEKPSLDMNPRGVGRNRAAENPPAFSHKELNRIYDAVFRKDTGPPGFYFEDLGNEINSTTLRRRMIALKEGLARICLNRESKELHYQFLGRVNHIHTSRFHRDSADAHSFLMLGYEPTELDSQAYVADYTKWTEDVGISLAGYFNGDPNNNIARDDRLLSAYTVKMMPFPKENYRLLLLNNSKSYTEPAFGVFHRADVSGPASNRDRIVNYMMLYLKDKGSPEYHGPESIKDFIETSRIAR